MGLEASIIELAAWMRSAPGQCLLRWEQQQLDQAVADVFGYHALQLGLPELQALRANRMPHRWLASDSVHEAQPLPVPPLSGWWTCSPTAVGGWPLPAWARVRTSG